MGSPFDSAHASIDKMMRYTLLLALAFGCASATRHYVKPEVVVDFINTKQSSWKAEVKERPIESIAKKLMDVKYTKQPEPEDVAPETPILANIPDAFDARTAWPSCTGIGFIRDQSDCGSCWAFGAAEAMSDRLCIATKGATNLKLSADDLLSCCGKSCGNGCEGGYPIDAWKYWVKNGLVTGGLYGDTNTCRPYEISPCGTHNQTVYPPCPPQEYDTPTCKKECVAGYPKSYVDDKHFGASAYAVSKKVATIQQEIMNNGPVEAAYTVYEDFYYYKSGIYSHSFGSVIGGHAVKILGWGVDDQGTPYWLVANSWNTDWGENGFFRILRGVNECGIEGGIVAGMPKN